MIYSSDYRHPLEEAIRGELERVLAFEELQKYYEGSAVFRGELNV